MALGLALLWARAGGEMPQGHSRPGLSLTLGFITFMALLWAHLHADNFGHLDLLASQLFFPQS